MAQNTNNKVDYEASCQCDKVAYTVSMEPLESVNVCDCSVCYRNGYALVYIPRDDVTWIRGFEILKEFQFNTKRLTHKFCPDCGSSILIDPNFGYKDSPKFKGAPDILCLNVRMMKGIDIKKLKATSDGWTWKPPTLEASS